MSGSEQRKSQDAPISVSVVALANNLDAATATPPAVQTASATSRPVVLIWDQSASIPQLIKIETVCNILSVEKSTVYELVASHELRPPLKFGTSRRAASRWLLSDVVAFIHAMAANRPVPPTTVRATSAVDDRAHPEPLRKTSAATKKTRQAHPRSLSAGGAP